MIFALADKRVITHGDFFVAENAIVVGSVVLENNVSIWYNTVVRGDDDLIAIGENTNVQDGSVLHTDIGVKLTIGKNVSIGHMVNLHGCTIGDNSLIGINSVILNNAKIGNNCLIGASTLIAENKVIPDNSLVIGVPGRIIRSLSERDVAEIRRNAEHYVQNFKRFKKECVRDERFS
jgi:carbonic anhydrase/acetyltransferase-like protein (isoleucine patch superfamily)